MARQVVKGSKLILEFDAGLNEQGKQKIKRKTLAHLNKSAEIDAVLAVSQKIGKLVKAELTRTLKEDQSLITE